MSFHKKAIEELSKYKQASKYFNSEVKAHTPVYRGKTRYHILPEPQWNLLESNLLYKDSIINGNNLFGKVKLPPYFCHMTSSQAMAINFFIPLIMNNQIELVLRAFGIGELLDPSKKIQFEYKSSIDSNRSSIDVYIPLLNSRGVYIEVKYSEGEFGRNQGKDWANFKRKYYNAARGIFPSQIHSNDQSTQKWCLTNYQIIRNAIHVLGENTVKTLQNIEFNSTSPMEIPPVNYVVFIYPSNNKTLMNKAARL
jgi:hypothetical protein